MNIRKAILLVASSLVFAVVVSGCASEPSNRSGFAPTPDVEREDEPDAGTPDLEPEVAPDVPCFPVLAFVSEQNAIIATEVSADLTVRYETCDGVAIPDALVNFAVVGDAADTLLQAQSGLTDPSGEVSASIRTGTTETAFELHVSAPDAEAIVFTVTISRGDKGAIEVTINPDDPALYDIYVASLYDAYNCAGLDPYLLSGALMESAEVLTLETHPTLTAVLEGTGYSVAVLAKAAGAPLGFGCVDDVAVSAGVTTQVEVVVEELPIVFTGVYDLDNHFDLSSTLPPSVASTIHIFDEMTDDDDVNGDIGDEEFGIDPAAFILDFIYRQICCWEATGSNPSWSSCSAQEFKHPFGDLSALYLHDFTSWSGGQPRFTFLCGGLAFANVPIQQKVQEFILANVPDIILDLTDIAGDLSRAFTEMHILSELTLKGVTADAPGSFIHELETMVIEIHDTDGELTTVEVDLLVAGLDNLSYTEDATVNDEGRLAIPDHSFQLDFGLLLSYIYTNVLLPTLECDIYHDGYTEPCTSTADLFATWIDCVDVGERIYLLIEAEFPLLGLFVGPGQLVSYCYAGIDAAGDAVEGQILDYVDAETVITIGGTCAAGTLNERRESTTLVDGIWEGGLSEDDEYVGDFFGVFTGTRLLEL